MNIKTMDNTYFNRLNRLIPSRLAAILALAVFFIIFYLGANHYSPFPTYSLPIYDWEKAIPFLPWTIFFYLLAYAQAVLVIILLSGQARKKALLGLLALIAFHGIWFFFWPTAYPRPLFPETASAFSRFGYNLIVSLDSPSNCFPSLHVAVAIFSWLAIRRKSRVIAITLALASLLTIASTLTLKQHFFLDIIGGALTAIIFYLIFLYEPRR